MIRVYVAGPLTVGDWGVNIHAAHMVGNVLRDAALGINPVIPHRKWQDHVIRPRNYEHWMTECMDDLESCDVLYRIPGDSPGADREVKRALELGKGVFYTLTALLAWAEDRYP